MFEQWEPRLPRHRGQFGVLASQVVLTSVPQRLPLCHSTNRAYVEHPLLFAVTKPVYWERRGHGTGFQTPSPAQSRKKRWEGRRKATASLCISSPCVRLISTGMYTATDGTTVPCCVSSPQSLSCMCVCSVQPGSPRWVAGSQCCCSSQDLLLTPSLNQCSLLSQTS